MGPAWSDFSSPRYDDLMIREDTYGKTIIIKIKNMKYIALAILILGIVAAQETDPETNPEPTPTPTPTPEFNVFDAAISCAKQMSTGLELFPEATNECITAMEDVPLYFNSAKQSLDMVINLQ